MKTRNTALLIILFLLLTLCACTSPSKEDVLKHAEQFIQSHDEDENANEVHFGYQKGIGSSWLTPEKEYIYNPDGDNSDGIIDFSTGGYINIQDRLYFQISKQTKLSTGDDFWAYVSTKTGEKHYICPDPLCGHDRYSGCPYINLTSTIFNPYSDTTMYSVRQSVKDGTSALRSTMYEIDLAENTLRPIYNSESISKEAHSDFILFDFIIDNTLYFRNSVSFKEIVDGEKVITEQVYLLAMDLQTKEVRVLNDNFDENIIGIFIIGDRIFYNDSESRTLYCTDFNFENKVAVLTYAEDHQPYNRYYDEVTGELYILIGYGPMHDSAAYPESMDTAECTIYRINENLECTPVPMPSSLILEFQLTREYIYYRKYDPVNYKTDPNARETIDIANSKLYRVKRSDTMTPELVFDGHGEIFFPLGYYVTGDYLYLDYFALLERPEGKVFRRMCSSVRVNMRENTIKWMNLD